MSRVVAVIPVRGSSSAKTRLAPLFTEDERLALVWAMLRRLIEEIDASGVIEQTVIVTRDEPAVRSHIPEHANLTVLDQGAHVVGLNGGLEFAREWAVANGFEVLLVLPADLPLINADDIRALIQADGAFVFATDRGDGGTNAIRIDLRSPEASTFRFLMGKGSLAHHRHEVSRLGAVPTVVSLPRVAHDLDSPNDWADLASSRQRMLLEDIHESLLAAGHLA